MSEKQVLTAWQRLTQLRNEIKVNKSIKNDLVISCIEPNKYRSVKPLEVKYDLAFLANQVVVDQMVLE